MSQVDMYKQYLKNVRDQSTTGKRTDAQKKAAEKQEKKDKEKEKEKDKEKGYYQAPIKFSHAQLEKDRVITESDVPENKYVLEHSMCSLYKLLHNQA